MNEYKILASTGTFVGRANNCDYTKMVELKDSIKCDGFEYMMMSPWYGSEDKIASMMNENNVKFYTLHTDKNIGVNMEQGQKKEALEMLKRNLDFAKKLGASKAVVHLWAGMLDDQNKKEILETASEMRLIGEDKQILVTIENIPSVNYSPLSLWEEILEYDENVEFTFDTRFATYYDEYMKIFESDVWKNVKHIHISSFDKNVDRTKKIIRPILHPGEGIPDYDHLLSNMPKYRGTITLESPVLSSDGNIDIEKLNTSLEFLRNKMNLYTKE